MTSSFFVMNLGQYLHDASQLSLAEFVAEHPDPCLLVDPFVPEEEPQLATSAGELGGGNVPFVIAIRSRLGGSHGYGDRITLGRTGNNDLVIRSSDVSKIHGFFMRDAEATTYTDVHSSYGSKVDEVALHAGKAHTLQNGSRLAFASVTATFYDPPGLYEHLSNL